MKKLFIAAAAFVALPLLSLSLGGCTTAQGTVITADAQALADKVQQGVQTACSYELSITTALSLASAFVPASGPVDAFLSSTVTGVCGALAASKAGASAAGRPRAGAPAIPAYNGVVLSGRPFVKPGG